jgi:hypothetical protein
MASCCKSPYRREEGSGQPICVAIATYAKRPPLLVLARDVLVYDNRTLSASWHVSSIQVDRLCEVHASSSCDCPVINVLDRFLSVQ